MLVARIDELEEFVFVSLTLMTVHAENIFGDWFGVKEKPTVTYQ